MMLRVFNCEIEHPLTGEIFGVLAIREDVGSAPTQRRWLWPWQRLWRAPAAGRA